MKRVLSQLFNLSMACVVLLSSTGFGLVEHSCQMRGTKKTTVVAFTDARSPSGCPAGDQSMRPEHTVVKKTACCQEASRYAHLHAQSSLSQLVAKFVKTVTESVLTGVATFIVYLADWVFDRRSVSVSLVESPPSPSGRDILTLVRSLLL